MKTLFILVLFAGASLCSQAQSCTPSCEKKSCGPEGTKKEEAAVISTMRSELQTVITRMSKSSLSFDKRIAEMKIEKGTSDDESLFFISQAANSIRHEFVSKIESSKLVVPLREYEPLAVSTKQQMVSALKKEIQILTSQAERL
jgi:hypothetical protein